MAASNALDRLREQRALRLLDALQDDLRAQMRLEGDELGRNAANLNARVRRKARIAQLADPQERERIWSREQVPSYDGVEIRSLPKQREFWRSVDITTWRKVELDAACTLLDLPTGGKKQELVARVQDWVHEPEILARLEQQRLLELEQDAVLASGRVFAFGRNFSGELGLGHRRSCETPTEIESFRGMRITRVYSGFDANFAFARAEDGRIYAWGGGGRALFDEETGGTRNGQRTKQQDGESETDLACEADSNGNSCFLLPRELPALSNKQITGIAIGRTHGHIAMTSAQGDCFTWGRGEYGELGTGKCGYSDKDTTVEPQHIDSFNKLRLVGVSVGNTHTAAMSDRGKLFTWGSCWSGQLGLGETKRAGVKDKRLQLCFPSPTLVELLQSKRITRVSCGAVHTAVVSTDGQLFTFGCGDGGRLGIGGNEDSFHPQQVVALEKHVVLDVCCGSWHSICIARPRDASALSMGRVARESSRVMLMADDSEGGFVYAFGSGLQGQLGLGKQKLASLPTCIPTLRHRQIRCRAIATSSHHSCALATDGNLYTWGQNASGCLGRKGSDVGATDLAEPDVVDRGSFRGYGVGPIVSVAAGHRFTLFATGPWEPREEPSKAQFQLQTKVNRHAKHA